MIEAFGQEIPAHGHIPYTHAYELCQEMLTALMIGMAAIWAHVVWLHHSMAKRIESANENLGKLLKATKEQSGEN